LVNKPGNKLQSTAVLLEHVRIGDSRARELLCEKYIPILNRWAHGRLPAYARNLLETSDLVQVTLLKALSHIDKFEASREGAFLAYMRQILLNSIRDEIRRSSNMPLQETFSEAHFVLPSAVEESVGKDLLDSYEKALMNLNQIQREAVILRVEFGYTFSEIAEAINSASANAARMMVSRALVCLAETMQ